MNSADRQTSTPFDVSLIERQLGELWKEAGGESDDSGVTRACLANLVVYSPSVSDFGKVNQLVAEVTASQPSRVITLLVDREARDHHLAAEVSSHCTLSTDRSKQLCCEEVRIHASGNAAAEVPSAVVPLLLSDLPVYLWWRGVPQLVDKVFSRLVDISSRVIIDSSRFADPQGDLLSLGILLRDSPRWAAFSDLNWSRLTGWRALLASFYDVAEYRPLLDRLNRVVIEFGPPQEDSAALAPRALLVAGWLASRLGWEIDPDSASSSEGATSLGLRRDGRSLAVHCVRSSNVAPGHLGRVSLECDAQPAASFTVRRSADNNYIETVASVGTDRHLQRTLAYENATETDLIGRELDFLGHDEVYEKAVLTAAEMVVAAVTSGK